MKGKSFFVDLVASEIVVLSILSILFAVLMVIGLVSNAVVEGRENEIWVQEALSGGLGLLLFVLASLFGGSAAIGYLKKRETWRWLFFGVLVALALTSLIFAWQLSSLRQIGDGFPFLLLGFINNAYIWLFDGVHPQSNLARIGPMAHGASAIFLFISMHFVLASIFVGRETSKTGNRPPKRLQNQASNGTADAEED